MSVKIYKNGAWEDASSIKTYKNGAWTDATSLKVYEDGAWTEKLIQPLIVKYYGKSSIIGTTYTISDEGKTLIMYLPKPPSNYDQSYLTFKSEEAVDVTNQSIVDFHAIKGARSRVFGYLNAYTPSGGYPSAIPFFDNTYTSVEISQDFSKRLVNQRGHHQFYVEGINQNHTYDGVLTISNMFLDGRPIIFSN